jgi:formate hydrogenlyase subunit 6/NADH:ubiquinone oxidoreductase subunit I
MRESFLSSITGFLVEIGRAISTLWRSSQTIFPYMLGKGELRKKVTEQYPDPVSSRTEDDLPARTRGILSNDIEKCTGCGDCRRICPVHCIRIETLPGKDLGRPLITVFDIDLGRCISCGLCVEVCHPGSLVHTKRFEGAVTESQDLVLSFGKGRDAG